MELINTQRMAEDKGKSKMKPSNDGGDGEGLGY